MLETASLLAAACWRGAAGWGPGPWWPVFPALWLLFFIGLAVFLFFVARRRPWGPRPSGPSGEAVLQERFARGEIDEREYRERLGVMREQSS
ncbi:MAG TPA: SHOCT domain-containing protein [Actinomycetota bacterium]|nr:SHOCT domain-containing protein [Actinomycetota bacterium]